MVCQLCPRRCGADRSVVRGACGAGAVVRIARVGLHAWEEPCLSYGKGSGTVFFSGCPLGCVFCQNHAISFEGQGRDVRDEELDGVFLSVRDMGAVNLNLVSPTPYVPAIAASLRRVKDKLGIPVVYNTGGYERPETLRALEGLVDIYLPDMKYASNAAAARYSGAPDYPQAARAAIREMFRQVGYPRFDEDGHMTGGVLVRHLVLPSNSRDSMRVLDILSQDYDPSRLYVSLMRQYFPCHRAHEFPEIDRRLTTLEYERVTRYALSLGIVHGFIQERDAATEDYVPPFDY